jgi:hypothetical protein
MSDEHNSVVGLCPQSAVQALLHTNWVLSPTKVTLLLFSLYAVEVGKIFLGKFGQRVLQILWRVFVSRPGRYRLPATTADHTRVATSSATMSAAGDEMDFEDIYSKSSLPEEVFDVVPADDLTADDTGDPTGPSDSTAQLPLATVTLRRRPTAVSPLPSLAVETVSSSNEDRKAKKGNQFDVEKLRSRGYNRYRYVSQSFIKRNKLRQNTAAAADDDDDDDDEE